MSRNNILGHLAIALVLVLIAAFAGQIHKWQKDGKPAKQSASSPQDTDEEADEDSAESDQTDQASEKTEALVRFRSGVTQDAIEKIAQRLNDQVEDRIESVDGLDVIEDEDGKDAESVVAQYRALPEVEYAEANSQITLDHDEGGPKHVHADDELFLQQWGLFNSGQKGGQAGADISAMRAWAVTRGSDQVVVAVLDSGVDYSHPDLANNIWSRPQIIKPYEDDDLTEGAVDDVHGFNVVDDNGDPMDDNGHGTHCAGIIGAEGGNGIGIAGVNWTVKIMPLRFMDADGTGTTKDAIEAINYVIDRKRAGVNVRIISASWGSMAKSRALEDVIRKAYEADILFVAAAGNAGSDNDQTPHYPSSYNLGNVVSVAALNRHNELASFSNYGAKSVHVAAPGQEILSTWLEHGFTEKQGTSMATPFVSGVAALILAENPKMSVDDLRARLLKSVDVLPSLKGKVSSGGRINAAKAVGAE